MYNGSLLETNIHQKYFFMSDNLRESKYGSKEEKDRQYEKEFMHLLSPLYNFAYRLTLDEDDANEFSDCQRR